MTEQSNVVGQHPDSRRPWWIIWRHPEPHWFLRDVVLAVMIGLLLIGVQSNMDAARSDRDQRLENLRFVREHSSASSTDERAFQNIDLQDMVLSGLSLRRSDFRGAQLSGVNAAGTRMETSRFDRADLNHIRMNSADVRGSTFFETQAMDADFTLVNFDYSDLRNSKFSGANFDHAVLDNAHIESSDLSSSLGLQTASLNNVCYDSSTKWPPGFSPPPSRQDPGHCGPSNYPGNK